MTLVFVINYLVKICEGPEAASSFEWSKPKRNTWNSLKCLSPAFCGPSKWPPAPRNRLALTRTSIRYSSTAKLYCSYIKYSSRVSRREWKAGQLSYLVPRYIITLHELLAHTPHDHVERKSLQNARQQLEDLSRQMHDEARIIPTIVKPRTSA
ncbi:unnamed protein product [Nesidiocoris tenuis]|uniref:DH domain-containing protein n=1 Tax=Nesidiocoris tenuis TaxID=355587 RepID=A0A6H5G0Z3_9HEMI|nr:unnamed protein product [Nesidiocoris tenuis]